MRDPLFIRALETLREVSELIEGYVDVRDGGALGPLPNDAMRAQQLIAETLAIAERKTPGACGAPEGE